MALGDAHEGYSYQDLLNTYFILDDLVKQRNSDFLVDLKEYKEDRFDDLTIRCQDEVFKKQIKYSNDHNDHRLSKDDIANDGNYQLALHSLFVSWATSRKKPNEVRLCLAWSLPDSTLMDLMETAPSRSSFENFDTTVLRFNIEKFWPEGGTPAKGWNKFRGQNLNRTLFADFLEVFRLELEMPKFTEDLQNPGPLERLVLEKVDSLGIGYFPNDRYSKEEFVWALMAKVRKHRSSGSSLSTNDIYNHFGIKTDYGAIEQSFPVIGSQNISTDSIYEILVSELRSYQLLAVTGEPGMGKSWLIENLKTYLQCRNIPLIRHLCYTDLSDKYQTQRILLNVFYGNLINEILELFPNLKSKKQRFFASTLDELNLLLSSIEEETILVIDGLDHVERIYASRGLESEITKSEIDIFGAIEKLQPSPYVRILVIAQPMAKLLGLSAFKQLKLPPWEIVQIKQYLNKINIEDSLLLQGEELSVYLKRKTNGNPLYLRYILKEIEELGQIDLQTLEAIPSYDSGLQAYYKYLLNKLNLREQVPRILSGVNFTLSLQELKDITGDGDYVEESLSALLPVIKLNVSQNGYSIYHESFRRFILAELERNNISITKNIFEPVTSWMESNGVINHPKSFRYYFQFVFENGNLERLLPYCSNDFIYDSVLAGQYWDLIKDNVDYISKATLRKGALSDIFLVTELNKVMSTTGDAFDENLLCYLTAIGHMDGFYTIADYLVYDGKPTLGLKQGLQVCKLCFDNNVRAPWQIYLDYYQGTKFENADDAYEVFTLALSYHIESENLTAITRIGAKLVENENSGYGNIFQQVLEKFDDNDFVIQLLKDDNTIRNLYNQYTPSLPPPLELESLWMKLQAFDRVDDENLITLDDFIQGVANSEDVVYNYYIDQLSNINWFNNWLIFSIEIQRLILEEISDQAKVLDCFHLLACDTEAFKGAPRTTDLYGIRRYIWESIEKGIRLVTDSKIWPSIVDCLIKVSEGTSTSLQKSLMGPLTTDKLFEMLLDHSGNTNRAYIAESLEELLEHKKQYHLHSYIAEYYYRLAVLYTQIDIVKSKAHLRNGVNFTLGYTFRRDMAIEDLLVSIESLHQVDIEMGLESIQRILPLVNAVVNHTDGKSTQHFPVDWFEKFNKIDPERSAIYLLNQLAYARLDWRWEDSLAHMLEYMDGDVDPILEMYFTRTFPVLSSHKFLDYSLVLLHKLSELDWLAAERYLGTVFEKFKPAFRNKIDLLQAKNLRLVINMLDSESRIDPKLIKEQKPYTKSIEKDHSIGANIRERKDFSDMDQSELSDYFSKKLILNNEWQSIFYLFEQIKNQPEQHRPLIEAFFSDNYRFDGRPRELEEIFHDGEQMEEYYRMMSFMNDISGYFDALVNKEAFIVAYRQDDKAAVSILREKMETAFDSGYPKCFSGNLFNAFSVVGIEPDILKTSWLHIFDSMSRRLPDTTPINWQEELELPFEMTREEVLFCILLTRFKAGTTERFQWALSGLVGILYTDENKLIKPFCWFFTQWKNFKPSIQLTILQLIYDYNLNNKGYGEKFKEYLIVLYPTRRFLLDVMIEEILDLPLRKLVALPPKMRYRPMSEAEFNFFRSRNHRHIRMESYFVELAPAFEKAKNEFEKQLNETEDLALYANRMYERTTSNIYFADHILDSINTELYEDLYNSLLKTSERRSVIREMKLMLKGIVAYCESICSRDNSLTKPSQISEKYNTSAPSSKNGWIRLAHYELELIENQRFKLSEIKLFAAVQFTALDCVEFPFSTYLQPVESIFDNKTPFNEEQTMMFFQKESDGLEDYVLLWVHSKLVDHLKLTVQPFNKGLYAIDKKGDVGLKFNAWKSDYLALGATDRLSDEIPKLSGGELLIREDLYQKIVAWIGMPGKYFTYKIS
ncbi:ATP-binding protein [Pedobacter borealis]|uniref:ATP-binding protein n=1 Tax=Pedobacter borealis TaxID=475254 RepID=UPI000493467C|nr:ATP-binding protein [Pedobacter borealis]